MCTHLSPLYTSLSHHCKAGISHPCTRNTVPLHTSISPLSTPLSPLHTSLSPVHASLAIAHVCTLTSGHGGRRLGEHRRQPVVDGSLLGHAQQHHRARLHHVLGRPETRRTGGRVSDTGPTVDRGETGGWCRLQRWRIIGDGRCDRIHNQGTVSSTGTNTHIYRRIIHSLEHSSDSPTHPAIQPPSPRLPLTVPA